jgi:quercetin dioxygenase-like cupin family protein
MSGIVSLFECDIEPILALLPELQYAWAAEPWRNSMPHLPRRDTESIFIRQQPGSRPRDALHQLASVATQYHQGPLSLAVEAIYQHTQGRPARAMLVRLRPSGVIEPHTDEGTYAEATTCFHLPIVTNPGAWMEVDGNRYHLTAGTVFAVDKHALHSAGNDGDEATISLVVDVHPDSPGLFAG